MRKFLCNFFLFVSIFGFTESSLPKPYNEVTLLPFYDPDEHPGRHDVRYKQIFKDHKIETVIEVGSWLGNSARIFAARIPEHGKIYAVDHWLGSIEQQSDPFLPHLYQQFLSNIIHSGYTNKVIPVKNV